MEKCTHAHTNTHTQQTDIFSELMWHIALEALFNVRIKTENILYCLWRDVKLDAVGADLLLCAHARDKSVGNAELVM